LGHRDFFVLPKGPVKISKLIIRLEDAMVRKPW
jgi:hypothetical protein